MSVYRLIAAPGVIRFLTANEHCWTRELYLFGSFHLKYVWFKRVWNAMNSKLNSHTSFTLFNLFRHNCLISLPFHMSFLNWCYQYCIQDHIPSVWGKCEKGVNVNWRTTYTKGNADPAFSAPRYGINKHIEVIPVEKRFHNNKLITYLSPPR